MAKRRIGQRVVKSRKKPSWVGNRLFVGNQVVAEFGREQIDSGPFILWVKRGGKETRLLFHPSVYGGSEGARLAARKTGISLVA
jgi:hypothetical protein